MFYENVAFEIRKQGNANKLFDRFIQLISKFIGDGY